MPNPWSTAGAGHCGEERKLDSGKASSPHSGPFIFYSLNLGKTYVKLFQIISEHQHINARQPAHPLRSWWPRRALTV